MFLHEDKPMARHFFLLFSNVRQCCEADFTSPKYVKLDEHIIGVLLNRGTFLQLSAVLGSTRSIPVPAKRRNRAPELCEA